MFNNKLRKRISYLEEQYALLEERIKQIEDEVFNEEYLSWKDQSESNRKTAANQGYFYLNSKCDNILLERVLHEINKNEDLTALFRTSDGATLSLRVCPVPKSAKTFINKYEGGAE